MLRERKREIHLQMSTPNKLQAGLDEAGRGSILGPMVIAGVSADETAIQAFKEMGVKDSKVVNSKTRSALYEEIKKLSTAVSFVLVHPPEIDRYVKYGRKYRKLNFLEAMHMAKVINGLRADEVYVDAPDTNPLRFAEELSDMLSPCPRLVAEHRADANYVIVSAASIVAKVERDAAVAALRDTYGDFGSGYPSDDQTIAYLREWVVREGVEPPFARKSWRTWERVFVKQMTL